MVMSLSSYMYESYAVVVDYKFFLFWFRWPNTLDIDGGKK